MQVNNLKNVLVIVLLLTGLVACKQKSLDYKAYMKYMADSENGLIKERDVTGIKLKVKYLPVDYLTYNAVTSEDTLMTKDAVNEIKKTYENSLTFVLNLGPTDDESFTITKVGLENYEQFAERIETMSFNMSEFIRLKAGDKEYAPDLVQLESINTLEESRNIIVVFNALDAAGDKLLKENMTFIYNDELFYTGINQFVFKSEDINALPQLNIGHKEEIKN